ncbi:MAG: FAD-dependent oxidoreductase [Planctomycetes bacterium]|nr:FAD-dependent oxidoreductase [Planctomycetota bacterium]
MRSTNSTYIYGNIVNSTRVPIQVEIPDNDYWRRQIKCQDACPVGTDARGYVRAIATGDFAGAYLIARGPNPLASICGRVCAAPCEAACRRGAIDQAVSIRALKRFAAEKFGAGLLEREMRKPIDLIRRVLGFRDRRQCSSPEELAAMSMIRGDFDGPPAKGQKVAIIGSGPAGLAAAHDLALMGLQPIVFEMEPIPAGMLAVGIPEYRLPRDLIEAEVEVIRSLGVEFVCNTQVGRDITLQELRDAHRATVIAVGAKRSRLIPIKGAEGRGVFGGVEFLRDVALRDRSDASTLSRLGKKVVVIGGGNVAFDVSRTVVRQIQYDVSRTALRQEQVGEVHLCCLESLDEMPADDVEIIEGAEEGVQLHPSLGPEAVLRNASGGVSAVKFKRCLSVFDQGGRFAPKFDDNDVTTIAADTVVWAIGQQSDISFIEPESKIERDDRGNIKCDSETLVTTAPDVFLAGDIAYGPRLLIDAVASGKKCARSIYSFITGHSLRQNEKFVQVHVPDFVRERDYEKLPRAAVPTASVQQRKNSQASIVELGYDDQSAVTEACRCLDCGVNTIFDSEKCILCGGCADVCPELCLRLVSCDRLVGDDGLAQLVQARYGEANLAEMSAIVKDEEKCIRCSLCADRCPVGAITMERFGFSSQWEPA